MTPAAARAQLLHQLVNHGETVTLRRYAAGTPTDYAGIKARVKDYEAAQLVGGLIQGDRWVLLSAEDVEASSIALPLKKGDKLVVRSRELNIERVDDSKRRIAGTLIAFELTARG